ncbi:hypothetical protein MPTK1_8g01880 [Marchantia polymorpha subsp. ruderalis]|uniref:Uncharacterized protein n=1 Tax=Marchantia polymorpha TaxID=3197 RepID=A0A2R6WR31_MARPO|nr:hypothetical protein MARPO_0064s0012 [Marchantia polymorpha]BBN18354.1 hypothetical protein Mp_8g01880 [Marchantia polymorpha subsp. ruderalis]|eukprot:PTQ36319.1 hypothetical protein MARPO_0064s0012 [Marchantia polymorpha]
MILQPGYMRYDNCALSCGKISPRIARKFFESVHFIRMNAFQHSCYICFTVHRSRPYISDESRQTDFVTFSSGTLADPARVRIMYGKALAVEHVGSEAHTWDLGAFTAGGQIRLHTELIFNSRNLITTLRLLLSRRSTEMPVQCS